MSSEKYANLVKRVKDKEVKEVCGKLTFASSASSAKEGLPALILRFEAKRTANNPQKNTAVVDEAILRLAPYFILDDGSGKLMEKVSLSLDPFVAFPLKNFFEQQGVKISREKELASGAGGVVLDVPCGDLDTLKKMDVAKLEAALVVPGQAASKL